MALPRLPSHYKRSFATLTEPLSVRGYLAFYGIATRDIQVTKGGVLLLYGTCAGNLYLHAGAKAIIYGFVAGQIENSGGEVHIFGTVIGTLIDTDNKNLAANHVYPVANCAVGDEALIPFSDLDRIPKTSPPVHIGTERFSARFQIINKDLRVTSRAALHSVVSGDIRVESGAVLILYGLCGQNLYIEENAKVLIYGTVVGQVINLGGELAIMGKVIGGVSTQSGQTWIDPQAQVLNPPTSLDEIYPDRFASWRALLTKGNIALLKQAIILQFVVFCLTLVAIFSWVKPSHTGLSFARQSQTWSELISGVTAGVLHSPAIFGIFCSIGIWLTLATFCLWRLPDWLRKNRQRLFVPIWLIGTIFSSMTAVMVFSAFLAAILPNS